MVGVHIAGFQVRLQHPLGITATLTTQPFSGRALKLIDKDQFRELVPESNFQTFLEALKGKYPSESGNDVYEIFVNSLFGSGKDRKHYISRLVHYFVTNVMVESIGEFTEPLIRYRAKLRPGPRALLDALQELIKSKVIRSAEVQHLEFKGQKMVVSVFEAFESDPESFLPADAYADFKAASDKKRVICDHVAGMTDSFLLKTYDRLFSPRMGSVFDKL